MTVTIVLNGDIESCCTFTPANEVESTVRGWIGDAHALQVINLERTEWTPDTLAATAIRYFDNEAYPLVYIDTTLCTFGALPSKKSLLAYLNGDQEYGVTETDIATAAEAMQKEPRE
ncbi:MAG: hypothetical protein ACLFR8_07000 [Alkalispirochaeta sp.]